MAFSREKKEEMLKELKDKLSDFKVAIFVDYSGLDVKVLEDIRKELRKAGADFRVVKKTLLDMAIKDKIKESAIEEEEYFFKGQLALVLGYEDEITPAKTVYTFSKEVEGLKILSGILERRFVGSESIVALAQVPSREELLAKFAGSVNAPVSGFLNVLAGNLRGLAQVLSAISNK